MHNKSLTIDEERKLLRAWRKGDEDAGNQLVEAFRPWAETVARGYFGGHREDGELVAAAMEGIAETMRQFDLDRKINGRHIRFNSLARIIVNQTIQRQLASRAKAIDHLAFFGNNLPEDITDTLHEEPDCGEQKECVDRLMFLVSESPDLADKTKKVLKLFIKSPTATLKQVGDIIGMTKEGVRLHLLKIRKAVLNDPELADAAIEAGLNLGRET